VALIATMQSSDLALIGALVVDSVEASPLATLCKMSAVMRRMHHVSKSMLTQRKRTLDIDLLWKTVRRSLVS
jgi:hypothetical protein